MINFGIGTESGSGAIEELGINAKMNEFEAAMGLCLLDDIDMIIEKRKAVYENYKEKLHERLQVQVMNRDASMNYSYFPVLFDSEEVLLRVENELNMKNIFPRRYFYPSLDTLPYLKRAVIQPVSEDVSKRVLCLPLYPGLEPEVQRKIIDIILDTI
jgi:dTDP-4-amino-4,6-dideoxygalactose transaminase